MGITGRLRSHRRVAALLAGVALVLGATGCGEPFLRVEYDDLSDVTRVVIPSMGEDTPLLLEIGFLCAGDNLCTPDSVGFTLIDYFGRLCPEGEKNWEFFKDSYNCGTAGAELLLGSEAHISLPSVFFNGHGAAGELTTTEIVMFDLSYYDVRRIANAERDTRLRMGEVETRLPYGHRVWLQTMIARIEKDANPEARPFEGGVYATYDAETDYTRLQAFFLDPPDWDLNGMVLTNLEGRCLGRGWCGQPILSFNFSVSDSAHLSLNLANVEMILDDSLFWSAPVVEFSKEKGGGRVVVEIPPDVVEEMVGSSVVQFRFDTLAGYVTARQLSVLRRFWRRVTDAETSQRDGGV